MCEAEGLRQLGVVRSDTAGETRQKMVGKKELRIRRVGVRRCRCKEGNAPACKCVSVLQEQKMSCQRWRSEGDDQKSWVLSRLRYVKAPYEELRSWR